MAIRQSKYVAITSGVGGRTLASRKELIGLIFSNNGLIPTGTRLEFEEEKNVGEYFGYTSAEYEAASVYLGYVNKYSSAPKKIAFQRYAPSGSAPYIRSTQSLPAIAAFKAVSDGGLVLNMGGTAYTVSGLDFSSVENYAAVAAAVQAGVQKNSAGGELWTGATVTFDADNSAFVLTGGQIGEAVILNASAPDSGSDVSGLLGWNTASGGIVSNGTAAATLTETLDAAVELSNNFASFGFLQALDAEQIEEAAAWTNGQNNQFMYSVNVTGDDYTAVQAAVSGYSGVALNYDAFNGYAWLMPMILTASIDWDRANGVINFMYHQFANIPVSVSTDQLSDTLDALGINYNGATQQAGNQIAFYQRGTLQGEVTDMGVYVNEIWLKDAAASNFLSLLLALPQLPVNSTGTGIARTSIQSVLDEALNNGVISVGKELNATKKAYISQITGDSEAWREIYMNGYWIDVEVTSETVNGSEEYKIEYLLVYSKGDSIRKIEGTHTLI